MPDQFDPLYVWLGIPPKDQPPHHYRLLGLEIFEENPDVIDAATNRQTSYLHGMASGPNRKFSQELLNDVAAARACLLDPDRKAKYDEKLRKKIAEKEAVALAAVPDESAIFKTTEPDPAEPATAPVIPVICDACSSHYELGLEDAGTLVECVCGHVLTVPTPDAADLPSGDDPVQTGRTSGDVAGFEQQSGAESSPAAVAVAEPSTDVDSVSPSRTLGTGDQKKKHSKPGAGRRTRKQRAEAASDDVTDDETEEPIPKRKKSGWMFPAVIALATIVVLVVLLKVLSPDDPNDTPGPDPQSSSPDQDGRETPETNTETPEDPDDGDAGSFTNPLLLDEQN